MLELVTTRLSDIQTQLLEIITPRTILVGHSLNSDLTALKLTHPFIIDTAILYPHPRGPPLKSSLKWLAQKYLGREIQKNHGMSGHDSIEDARACLDLVKEKCERGPKWGTSEASTESIFKRLERSQTTQEQSTDGGEHRKGAVVDWGDPLRGYGRYATTCIACESDEAVVEGIKKVVGGSTEGEYPSVDFVWGRFRELEAIRGWWSKSRITESTPGNSSGMLVQGERDSRNAEDAPTGNENLGEAVSKTVSHVVDVYSSLPPCTAFIVYSGTGDPRETVRLQGMQQQFRKEYATKKWDELSVKWDDTAEQALKKACRKARDGIGFITVK